MSAEIASLDWVRGYPMKTQLNQEKAACTQALRGR